MIDLGQFRGRRVAVLGLARSGLATAAALKAAGAAVLAWDDAEAARAKAEAAGVPLHRLTADEAPGWAALVMSPGIPLTHPPLPLALAARAAGVPVVCDIELLWLAEPEAGFIGITGTNGKSTTTALIGHVLASAGRRVAVGGNLGIPALVLPALGAGGLYVLETSSFQLDLIERTRFATAILLNVTPDHLDRHGDMAGYVAAKERIFRNQGSSDLAIVGVDDDWGRKIAGRLGAAGRRVVPISIERPVAGGLHADATWLVDATHAEPQRMLRLDALPVLPGRHNAQNVLAAIAACREAGLDDSAIQSGLATFPGLAHRLERVGQWRAVQFVNDSKATNADAAAKALASYGRIHWIAGGRAKAGGIDTLRPYFDRLAGAYLIGEAADGFAAAIGRAAPVTRCGTLDRALDAAFAAAAREAERPSVVLLSPACASFDQFRDFEARGDAFRQEVAALLASVPP